jgi:hypothetical protein
MGAAMTMANLPVVIGAGTIFVPLPETAWRPIAGGCSCRYCSPNRAVVGPAWWDTLALQIPGASPWHGRTWTVHWPELHNATPKREKP